MTGTKRALLLPGRLVVFTGWFAWQVLISSGKILHDIATPGSDATARVVRMPLRSRTDAEVTLIGTFITLTPGTLTLGVVPREDGGRCLLVHSMYHADRHSALADLSHMEDRMLHALAVEDSR
ncbi:Na+/H+ antiporter subunit E [Aeromicrobium sp. CF4.19]|uniref:Na+/H+ antiporter subunit E n=1 Tax=Aeromicrobium sp. CF4.19 TaxID=3373082 RepID=UPI003EE7487B